jgi:hypothetical protein
MAGSDLGRKGIAIFLVVLALLLLLYIYSNGISAFQKSKSSTEKGIGSAADCVGEVFRISQISYNENTLRFKISYEPYSSVDEINTITVAALSSQTLNISPMLRSMSKDINIENFPVSSNFTVYADSCTAYKLVCNMELLECT